MKLLFIIIFVVFSSTSAYSKEHPVKVEKKILREIKTAYKEGKYKKAFESWSSAITRYDSSLMFHFWGAKILLHISVRNEGQRNKNFKKASVHLQRVITHFKRTYQVSARTKSILIESLFLQGLANDRIGNVELAIGIMKQVVKIDSANAKAWYNIGAFYEKRHNYVESNRAFFKYNKIITSVDDDF